MKCDEPNYYAIIPADVRYDSELKDKAKLLYGEITSLSNKDGYCYASNKYFADLYNVTSTTISLLIKNLIDRGYITSEIIYKEGSKEILCRYLKIIKYPYLKNLKEGYLKNFKEPIKENLKGNNTSNNNTSINIKEKYNKKKSYGEFKNVLLTDEEYQKLKQRFTDYEKKIENLSYYLESKGDKYKSHYATILNWSRKDDKEEKTPEWFNKEIKEDINEERKKLAEQLTRGTWKP